MTLDVPVDHPDFGERFPCECTLKEMSGGRTERLERYSNLGPLVRLTFENFKPEGLDGDPSQRTHCGECCKAARAYADDPRGWLVITGPSGCGKTHLAAAIANHCLKKGIPVFWTIVPDLLDHLRATFGPSSDVTYDDLFERVRNAPLLVLDDLGTHSSTPWAEEKLFQVLNHRFNAQLPTIVTAISLEDLDHRLQTRLRSPGLSRELKLKTTTPPLLTLIGAISEATICAMSFKSFDVRGMNADREQRESLRIALEAARAFAESPADWLVIVGTSGCGKTHLAAAVANHQIEAKRVACFVSVPELLDRLRSSFGPEGKENELTLERLRNCPLLILDDLRMEMATTWAREKMYQVLNYRYNGRLATLITATDPAMESLDSRLKSRLEDPRISNVVPIAAPDYRGGQDKPLSRSPSRRRPKDQS